MLILSVCSTEALCPSAVEGQQAGPRRRDLHGGVAALLKVVPRLHHILRPRKAQMDETLTD